MIAQAYLAHSGDLGSSSDSRNSSSNSRNGSKSRVSAHCIVDAIASPDAGRGARATGSGAQQHVALEARARWLPVAAADPSALPSAWKFANNHAASGFPTDDDSVAGAPQPPYSS